MEIKNITLPTDFSQTSQTALDYGVALARRLRARLTLLHVLEPQTIPDITTDIDIDKFDKGRRESALHELGALLAPEDEDDLNLELVLKSGNPRKEIPLAVEEQHADLVVMGTQGRGRLGRLILGSTAEALLRKLHVPVLTVSHVTAPRDIKRILFATDLSDASRACFGFVLEAARTLHADIVAMHAMGGPALTSGELGFEVQPEELALQEAHRRLEGLMAEGRRHGVTVQTCVADGPAAEQILKAAAETPADLILLTIESKGFFERALLGTTAEHVVREAAVPVLSVPVHVETPESIPRIR